MGCSRGKLVLKDGGRLAETLLAVNYVIVAGCRLVGGIRVRNPFGCGGSKRVNEVRGRKSFDSTVL